MAHAATPSLVRLAGPDRVGTAIEIAKQHATFNEYAILARADAYPDALAGAALAGAYQAPLYLTPSDHLDPRVLTQLEAQESSAAGSLRSTAALVVSSSPPDTPIRTPHQVPGWRA